MNKTEMKEKVMQAIRNMTSNELYSLCLEFSDVNGGCDPVYSMDEVRRSAFKNYGNYQKFA